VNRQAAAALTCLTLLAAGCGDDPVAVPTASAKQATQAGAESPGASGAEGLAAAEVSDEAELVVDPVSAKPQYTYNPNGRRDPFEPYRHDLADEGQIQTPLMAYELQQLSVVAVVWHAMKRRALIADPRGETHVVREGSPIGKNDGLVIHIGDNIVLVKETYVDFAGEMTTKDVELRIRRSQGG
jgi:type IV pilus assembly protein PilP